MIDLYNGQRKLIRGLLVAALILAMIISYMPQAAFAGTATVKSDGFTYTVDTSAKTAQLTAIDAAKSGEVKIPETVADGDGVTYNVTSMSLALSANKCAGITKLDIPDTITDMKSSDFGGFTSLTELTIPGSVKTFSGKMQNCASLKKLTFGEGTTKISTSNMVTGCTALTEINLPSTFQSISGTGTFSGASALGSVELPSQITQISSSTFAGCTSLTKVTAKGTLRSIGSSAFSGCAKLAALPDISNVTSIGSSAFKGCASLTSLDFSGLTTIPASLCEGDSALSSVDLGSSLTSIGASAFSGCAITGTLTIPDSVTSIGASAFSGNKIETLKVGSGITTINSGTFANNAELKTADISKWIKTIAAGAFSGCAALETATIHSSEDAVTVNAGAFESGTKVVFTEKSVGDAGDTISSEPGAPTLQGAIDASKDGDVITIKKNVKITTPLVVRTINGEAKNVTIKSSNGYTILSDIGKCDKLITIDSGNKLTLAGDVTLSGVNVTVPESGGAVIVHGELALADSAEITDVSIGRSLASGVLVSGSGAVMRMSGGKIDNIDIASSAHYDAQYSGAILVRSGGKLEMTGGTITGNTCSGRNSFYSSSGVMMFGNSTFDMSGGQITGNKAWRGSAAVLLSTGSTTAKFNMSGGTISNNSSKPYNSPGAVRALEAAGAVFATGSSDFEMTGGTITGNKVTDGAGGGVAIADDTITDRTDTIFNMYGGTISNNTISGTTAAGAGVGGGGVYVYSNGVHLYAGNITGNSAVQGGGVYSEGNATSYCTLHMSDAIITDNEATSIGGGMWFCPTGSSVIRVKNGAAIYGNTAGEAGDDFVTIPKTGAKYTVTLADRMLGGGSAGWHKDGGVVGGSLGGPDLDVPRYDAADPGELITGITDKMSGYALKAITTDGAIKQAQKYGKLIIKNNTAVRGGGVGANGGVDIGDTGGLTKLSVQKDWVGTATKPESIKVYLVSNGNRIDSVELTEANGWKGSFTDLPDNVDYTVEEETVSGWTPEYKTDESADGSEEVTITNTFSPPVVQSGSIEVTKAVTVNDAKSSALSGTFYVTLFTDSACTKPAGGAAVGTSGASSTSSAGTAPGTSAGTATGTSAGTTNGTSAGTANGTSAGTATGTGAGTTNGTSAGTTPSIGSATRAITVTNGKASTAIFTGVTPGTYYVAETNADGTEVFSKAAPVTGYKAGTITNNKISVTLTPGGTAFADLTNTYTTTTPDTPATPNTPSNPKTPTTPSTPPASGSSKTDDPWNATLWTILLLLGAAGVITPIAVRRRRSRM